MDTIAEVAQAVQMDPQVSLLAAGRSPRRHVFGVVSVEGGSL